MTIPDQRWKVQVAKFKLMYPHLADEDFQYDYGKREVMMEGLCKKTGKTRTELDALFTQLK
jgi:hypothetical protein